MENKKEKHILIMKDALVEVKFQTKNTFRQNPKTPIKKHLVINTKNKKDLTNIYKPSLFGIYRTKTVYYIKSKKPHKLKSLYQLIFKDNKQITIGFSLLCATIIPIFSLIFFFFGDATIKTMSYFGNQGHRLFFIIWGCCTGVLISLFLIRLYNTYKFANSKARTLAVISCIFLIICVFSPSLSEFPLLSNVHNLTAIAFAICTLLSFYFFIMYLKSINKKIGSISLVMYVSALFFPLLSYFMFGHSGVYEIVFFMVFAIFLFCLELLLKKNKNTLFYQIDSKLETNKKVVFNKYKCNGKILKSKNFTKLKGCNFKVKITPLLKQNKEKIISSMLKANKNKVTISKVAE